MSPVPAGHSYLDAVYCQLILAGLLNEYDLIHCVAPMITPLQLLAGGAAIVQTLATTEAEPASVLPRRLLGPHRITVVNFIATGADPDPATPVVPLSVDLERYAPAPDLSRHHLLWLGSGGAPGRRVARATALRLGMPLVAPDGACSPMLLSRAAALLLPGAVRSPFDHIWAARAMACGIPVVGCSGSGLEPLGNEEMLVAAPDASAFAAMITARETTGDAVALRRDGALAYYGRSAMAHRYRRIYDRATARQAER